MPTQYLNATSGYYDLTNLTTATNTFEFVKAINDVTGQWFISAFLIGGFVVLFMAMKRFGTQEALLGSGFVTSVLAVLLSYINFIPTLIMYFILIPFAILFAVYMVRE